MIFLVLVFWRIDGKNVRSFDRVGDGKDRMGTRVMRVFDGRLLFT
jgi:hypothetical protein